MLVGKVLHVIVLLGLPGVLHGWQAAAAGLAGYHIALSLLLSTVFVVSHNVPEAKPLDPGPTKVDVSDSQPRCCFVKARPPVFNIQCCASFCRTIF